MVLKMTPSELKYHIERAGNCAHFFTRQTMQFFGDTMKNYGVRETYINTPTRPAVHVYELFRRRPVKHGLISSSYFDAVTFKRVFPTEDGRFHCK